MAESAAQAGRQRIDRWLWHARITKSRTLAQRLLSEGGVRVNREKVDAPARMVGPGDVLTIALRGRVRVLRVRALSERRLPASHAADLYELVSEA